MSRSQNRKAWTSYAKNGQNKKDVKLTGEKLRQQRRDHDLLEGTCAQLSLYKWGIELYKADAQAVKTTHPLTGKVIYQTRCKHGIPDRICAIPPTGRFAGFEFKTGSLRNKPRPAQARVHEALIRNGAAVYVVRSVKEFEEFMTLLLEREKDKKLFQEIGEGQP